MKNDQKTGTGLASFAISKVGRTPYFWGAKFSIVDESFMKKMAERYPKIVTEEYMDKARDKDLLGKVCCDCSGLIEGYRMIRANSWQLRESAIKRMPIEEIDTFPIGTVLWKEGHCSVWIGNGQCVEARGIDYGVVISNANERSFSEGLLFSDLTYDFKSDR